MALSMGKNPMVAPYSGAMLASGARSASDKASTPGPKYSTKWPTTFLSRSSWTSVSAISVAVTEGPISPTSRTPVTIGDRMGIGCPSMAASASMPPTPHPRTPMLLTVGVCESVPTSVSGCATASLPFPETITQDARNSMLIWWQIPRPGGRTFRVLNAFCPQRRNL